MESLTYKQKIGMAVGKAGISQAELARRIGMSPQNFGKKASKGDFTQDELERMAKELGAEFQFFFSYPDGYRI